MFQNLVQICQTSGETFWVQPLDLDALLWVADQYVPLLQNNIEPVHNNSQEAASIIFGL